MELKELLQFYSLSLLPILILGWGYLHIKKTKKENDKNKK